MLRVVEVLDAPFPFRPLERLPIEVGMLPPPGQHPFDIERALVRLMGGWRRAGQVFNLDSYTELNTYDIVHLAGTFEVPIPMPRARLIILQVRGEESVLSIRMAEYFASQGPAVLAVASDEPEVMDALLFGIYAGIVHNRRLTEIVRDLPKTNLVTGILACSEVSDRALSLEPVLQVYASRGTETAARLRRVADRTEQTRERVSRVLHKSQRKTFELQLDDEMAIKPSDFSGHLNDLLSGIDWAHEHQGAIPLSDALINLPPAEFGARKSAKALDEVNRRLEEEATRAPRVLNANFAATDGAVIGESQPLIAETEYDLFVDVGPAWDKTASIVGGANEFPTESLPPTTSGGWNIDVVFVSEDFKPHTAATAIFVPDSGRSYPMIDGERAPTRGPVLIRLRAPSATDLRIARARLSLHYNGTVIQSAVIAVSVAQIAGAAVVDPNRITVDFVLSGSLRDIDQVIGTREVGLSLVMNDDGGSGHRFILQTGNEKLPAFLPYDPTGATEQLKQSRTALLELFYEKDKNLNATKRTGIQNDMGKDLEQFKSDLFVLAKIGNRLRVSALQESRPEDGGTSAVWRRELGTALLSKKIIHVARTHSSTYVYPWSLIYQHSLEGDSANWKYCDVIQLEWTNGRRSKPPADRCPFNIDEDDHRRVLCPYGFWGLKHLIEQPVSVAVTKDGKYDPNKNVTTKIARNRGKLRLAVGVTRDAKLDGKLIGTHLIAMRSLPTVDFAPPEAENADDMLRVLDTPQIVYFLCHGMYDKFETSVFLGIGPDDNKRDHRIYPSMLDDWTTKKAKPNLSDWTSIRPLVFINGCETMNVTPDQMLSFVSAFSSVPAGGIVGTEVSVQLPVAAEFARIFFEGLLAKQDMTVGEAMRNARWELANKGNLLGLAYTAYCMANLQFV